MTSIGNGRAPLRTGGCVSSTWRGRGVEIMVEAEEGSEGEVLHDRELG